MEESGGFGSGTAIVTIEKDEDSALAAIFAGGELDGALDLTLFDQAGSGHTEVRIDGKGESGVEMVTESAPTARPLTSRKRSLPAPVMRDSTS